MGRQRVRTSGGVSGLFIALLLVYAVGCNSHPAEQGAGGSGAASSEDATGASALRGEVSIDGSSTVAPLSRAAAGDFGDEYPHVKVTVGISGTGGGFKRFVQGELDISDASRPIKQDELALCQKNGVEFLELAVAYDGLSIVVNPENDWADQLTVNQLRQIYREDTAAKKWSELNPAWPDHEIHVYSPGHQSGTFDYFREVMAQEGEKPDDVVIRKETSTNEDDNVLVTGVARDKYAIGYFGASYYFNNRNQVRAVSIVNPQSHEAVAPTAEAVESGTYAPVQPAAVHLREFELAQAAGSEAVRGFLPGARAAVGQRR
jgi:phosphate transport system substrate-binding protein